MRWIIIFIGLLIIPDVDAQNYQPLKDCLYELNESRKTGSQEKIQQWWNALRNASQVPLIVEDSVYFFYKGSAESVEWMGDFNGWGYDKEFLNRGNRINTTDIWILKASFPADARLDYKIIIDGTDWILDPENRFHQWSGVGGGSPNSELRMPAWKEDEILKTRTTSNKGTLINDVLINSKILGYQVMYTVYLPHGFSKHEKLPSIYLTDGYEYLHPKMGNMSTVLDNLIEDKKIKPVIAIFVDHRSPVDRSINRRMQELIMNTKYLDFFIHELIPGIESVYPVARDERHRAIMGNSMGGLTATYFAFSRPDVFGMAGIQSPAFYTRPQIYSLCAGQTDPKMKISMTSGLIHDTSTESRKMKDVLETSSCIYNYREVNEGHSWGNWRGLIDDILIDLFTQTN